MLKKKSKYFIFLFLFVLSIFYNINNVQAETYDCKNEKYQCITCTYTYTSDDSITYTYYIKSDENANVTIVKDGNSEIKAEEPVLGKFIGTSSLQCPKMYYQYKKSSSPSYISYYRLTFDKQKKIKVGRKTYESEAAKITKTDNKKSFGKKKDDTSDKSNNKNDGNNSSNKQSCENCKGIGDPTGRKVCEDKYCDKSADQSNVDGVTICMTTIVSENKYATGKTETLTDKAKVTVNNDNVSVSDLPSGYNLSTSPVSSSITSDDYKNGCPNDIIVLCKIIRTSARDSSTETTDCNLVKQSEVPTNYVDSSTGIPVSVKVVTIGDTPSLSNFINTDKPYNLTCDDVDYLHTIWIIIWILSPILVIVFGSMDIFKAVISGDVKKIEEYRGKIPKRIISALVVAFIPTIISVAVGFSTNDNVKDTSLMYCIINGNGSSGNSNSNNSNGKSTNKRTTDTNPDLTSACESACSYAKYGNTDLYSSCKTKCINGYSNSCTSISDSQARANCYKNYAKKYKASN